MVDSISVIHEARECLETPFCHMGRLKGVGLDCIGLVVQVAKATGISLDGFADPPYGPVPDGVTMQKVLNELLTPIWVKDMTKVNCPTCRPIRPGSFLPLVKNADVLLMAWRRYPTHVGFAAVSRHGWNIIHAYNGCEFVTEHRLDESWLGRVRGVYRFKDVK